MPRRERVLVLGAAGRDFHNFNTIYRTKPNQYEVVGFTATQIPNIFGRRYPPELSGPDYPAGLPIWSEDELERLIKEERVDRCLLSYSDLSHHEARAPVGRLSKARRCRLMYSPPSALPISAAGDADRGAGAGGRLHLQPRAPPADDDPLGPPGRRCLRGEDGRGQEPDLPLHHRSPQGARPQVLPGPPPDAV